MAWCHPWSALSYSNSRLSKCAFFSLRPTFRRSVSVGKATVAMILNGLGFSNRQLYLVPQYFENKPVEHLLGEGITADMLNDDCLGRTLDWLLTFSRKSTVKR